MGEGKARLVPGTDASARKALGGAASMFSEAVCCLITHGGSHLPQTPRGHALGPKVRGARRCDLDLEKNRNIHRIYTNEDVVLTYIPWRFSLTST